MNRMPLALSHPLEAARTRAAAVPLAAHSAPFLRAMTRKPSCLISCNQRSSRGRSRAFVGSHGGTNPTRQGRAVIVANQPSKSDAAAAIFCRYRSMSRSNSMTSSCVM
jgi:hypothetical protein